MISGETNKLMNQEIREDCGDKAAEEDTAILQGDDEFNGADNEFEEARAEENVFDAIRAEESAARACSQRAGNLAGYEQGLRIIPRMMKKRKMRQGISSIRQGNLSGEVTSGETKCADVGPTHNGDSRGSGGETNKTGNYVVRGGKFTQVRNNVTVTTQGSDGRKLNAK